MLFSIQLIMWHYLQLPCCRRYGPGNFFLYLQHGESEPIWNLYGCYDGSYAGGIVFDTERYETIWNIEYLCRTAYCRWNALIASISDYTYKKECGWLLAAGGFNANLAVQSQSCLNMLSLMFLVLPFILYLIITVLNYFLKVEQANKMFDENK